MAVAPLTTMLNVAVITQSNILTGGSYTSTLALNNTRNSDAWRAFIAVAARMHV
jgi:hypothetical protein